MDCNLYKIIFTIWYTTPLVKEQCFVNLSLPSSTDKLPLLLTIVRWAMVHVTLT